MFCRTAERLSLTQAAEDLNITGAAISRQIANLEDHLGVKLLARSTRRVTLTEAGQKFYEAARRALAEMDRAERVAVDSRKQPGGRLRVSAPMSLGIAHISSMVSRFASNHPTIELELILDDHVVDIISEHFDLALRVRTSLPDSGLFAKSLASVRRVLCASPIYLERKGTPTALEDLRDHNCLAYTLSSESLCWTFEGETGQQLTVPIRGNLNFNNSLGLANAVKEGAGIALLPYFCVQSEIRSGGLLELLPEYRANHHTLFAVHAYGAMIPATLRVLLDFLVGEFARCQAQGLL